jgi:hypothetical protein
MMAELSEQGAAIGTQWVADTATKVTETNRHALDFICGTQKAMLDEMVLASTETLDRARTEMQLFSEFVSKLAGAHSVNNIQTMGEECSRHQIDFFRRDSERLFKHGERMVETTAKLLSSWRHD